MLSADTWKWQTHCDSAEPMRSCSRLVTGMWQRSRELARESGRKEAHWARPIAVSESASVRVRCEVHRLLSASQSERRRRESRRKSRRGRLSRDARTARPDGESSDFILAMGRFRLPWSRLTRNAGRRPIGAACLWTDSSENIKPKRGA